MSRGFLSDFFNLAQFVQPDPDICKTSARLEKVKEAIFAVLLSLATLLEEV